MRILVAGGAGYIGSALVPRLLTLGHDVTVIDICWFGSHVPDGCALIQKDIMECTAREIRGFDQVIFLAGVSNDPMAEYDPSATFIYNAALPARFALEAKKAGIRRFIYASSCSVYGFREEECDEHTQPLCQYPYGISKLQGEYGIHQLADDTFSVISLRQGTVSGHSPRMRFDLFVNTMVKTALSEKRIVVNNPRLCRPLFDMLDVLNAYVCALNADQSVSGVFNVATENYSILDAAKSIQKVLFETNAETTEIEVNNVADVRNYRVAIRKAKTVLQFQPQGSIERIVSEIVSRKDTYGDLNSDAYYNIRVFRGLQTKALSWQGLNATI